MYGYEYPEFYYGGWFPDYDRQFVPSGQPHYYSPPAGQPPVLMPGGWLIPGQQYLPGVAPDYLLQGLLQYGMQPGQLPPAAPPTMPPTAPVSPTPPKPVSPHVQQHMNQLQAQLQQAQIEWQNKNQEALNVLYKVKPSGKDIWTWHAEQAAEQQKLKGEADAIARRVAALQGQINQLYQQYYR